MSPLLHIEHGQRVDVALDFGQSIAELLGTVSDIIQVVPALGTAAKAVNVIIGVCQKVKRNKNETTLLARRCVNLLQILKPGSQTPDPAYSAVVDDTTKLLEKVKQQVVTWSEYNWLDELVQSRRISKAIADFHTEIEHQTEALNTSANIHNAQWQAAADEQRKVDNQSIMDRLDAVTKELSDVKAVTVLYKESAIRDQEQSWTEFMGLIQEVLSSVLDEKVAKDLGLSLWNLKYVTRLLPPRIDLQHRQVRFTSQFPIKSGERYDIYRGLWLEKEDVEIRRIKRSNSPKDKKRYLRYFGIWRDVWARDQGKYFLPFYGVVADASDDSNQNLPYFVSPWQKNGTLKEWVTNKSDTERLQLISYVCRGVQILHRWTTVETSGNETTKPIVHGDIRAENILVDDEGNPRLYDFSLSKILEKGGLETATFTQSRGADQSVRWFAPELTTLTTGDAVLTTASDIYSVGMMILEVMTDAVPYSDIPNSFRVVLKVANGVRPSRPPNFSDLLWDLVQECWHEEPTSRPNIEKVLEDLDKVISEKKA